jgi:hypothetical protein
MDLIFTSPAQLATTLRAARKRFFFRLRIFLISSVTGHPFHLRVVVGHQILEVLAVTHAFFLDSSKLSNILATEQLITSAAPLSSFFFLGLTGAYYDDMRLKKIYEKTQPNFYNLLTESIGTYNTKWCGGETPNVRDRVVIKSDKRPRQPIHRPRPERVQFTVL